MDGVRSTAATTATVVIVLAALGCGVDENVVATVGGREVEVADVQAYLAAATGVSWQAVDDRVASRLLDQFLDQEVMAASVALSRSRGIPKEPAARSSQVRALVAEVCGPPPTPTAGELEQQIEQRLEKVRPARAHVRQLLLPTAADAARARARLAAGETFLEVSREMSRAANASTGGELGVLARGTLPDELDDVVFSLAAGEVSEPVKSPSGFHVFQVLEVVPEGPASRGEVEPIVRRELADELARVHARRCVDDNAARVGVVVHAENLWFDYEGRYGSPANAP
jgi:parvulin-like peptidyl-prolyl isomerase